MDPKDFQRRSSIVEALQQQLLAMPGTQAAKAKTLGITQPRLNDLLKRRIEKFSLKALTDLSERAGLKIDLNVQEPALLPFGGFKIRNRQLVGNSSFMLDETELARLSTVEAARLFLKLLRCEVYAVGLSPKDIVLPSQITLADGGIDAKVLRAFSANGLLKYGDTYYQIKTGTDFKPWQPSKLKNELFGKSKATPAKALLGQEVKKCLDTGGTYCVVTFEYDLQAPQVTKSVELLKELLRACGYPEAKVEVIGQGQIAGEIERYPSIYRELFGFVEDGTMPIGVWATQSLMKSELVLGSEQQSFIDNIKDAIRSRSYSHLRVYGEPGIGKTRLVLEAVSDKDIRPTVIYSESGEGFQKSKLFKEIIQSESRFFLTIVVDDCSEKNRVSIWSALKIKSGITLITLDHSVENTNDSSIKNLECPRLDSAQIIEILQFYLGSRSDLSRWAVVCDGSPRVAHAVGENLSQNPSDILRQPSEVQIWERFIAGSEESNSVVAEEYRLVLRHIALFTRFGFEFPVSEEGEFIAKLVKESDPGISYARFQSIVQHFRRRRILQGSHTLFIVPKALHIKLWIEYWENHGRNFDFSEFFTSMPESMQDWFFRLIPYAHNASNIDGFTKSLLNSNILQKSSDTLITEVGSRILRYLSEADPLATLNFISERIGGASYSELNSWKRGRQDIVWALERIAVWETLFSEAAKLLMQMAATENASNSNNSTGVLQHLFSVGTGWASTEASPVQKYPLLKELIQSNDNARWKLGLLLAERWLKTGGCSRTVGPEYQGIRETVNFWKPKIWGEVFDAWRSVVRLLLAEFKLAAGHKKIEVGMTLIKACNGLIRHDAVSEEVVDYLFELAHDTDMPNREIVRLVIRVGKHHRNKISESIKKRIEDLDELLTGKSLWDRISRYVLHTDWDEDYVLKGKNHVKSELQNSRLEDLAREITSDNESLSSVLPQLLVSSGHLLSKLGTRVFELTELTGIDDRLISEVQLGKNDTNAEFLSGYLFGVMSADMPRWEKIVTQLLQISGFEKTATACVMHSGLNDFVLKSLSGMLLEEKIGSNSILEYPFRLPATVVSDEAFNKLIDGLIKSNAPDLAVSIVCAYCIDRENPPQLPRMQSLGVLEASAQKRKHANTMTSYYWGELAKFHIKQFPQDIMKIFKFMIFTEIASNSHSSTTTSLFYEIVEMDNSKAWKAIAQCLEGSNTGLFGLTHWIGNSHKWEQERSTPIIDFLPAREIIKWAKEDVDERLWLVIEMLPKELSFDPHDSLCSNFIEEFSGNRDVDFALVSHFWSGSWSGNESGYLEKKRDDARRLMASSESFKMKSFLSKFVDSMTRMIEGALIREEREF